MRETIKRLNALEYLEKNKNPVAILHEEADGSFIEYKGYPNERRYANEAEMREKCRGRVCIIMDRKVLEAK